MSALAQHRAESGDQERTGVDEAGAAETVDPGSAEPAAEAADAGSAEPAAETVDPGSAEPAAEAADARSEAEKSGTARPEPDAAANPRESDPTGSGTEAEADPDGPVPPGQGDPTAAEVALRADFGAHLEANYQRLVAQLYAITLDSGGAHEAVQDAYSQAWRSWEQVGRSADPTAWVRRVAVRSTMRNWRSILARIGIGRVRAADTGAADPRTAALLGALRRLSPAERRSLVLFHMVGVPMTEIAALERVSPGTVQARLSRARLVAAEGLAEVLPFEFTPYDDEDNRD
ncbi:RNA polymerase sigma factor [Pseudonocardia hispaniensis]|uniref:RNA polymerase sigma factor n=1 Tax=Pseudonocardia hispaniensis TaxID=904933 RepID=A0ABW1IX60_9PSEU